MRRAQGILLGVLMLFASPLWAYESGEHYRQLPSSLMKDAAVQTLREADTDKIQVVEFFSYGCHWCHALDTKVDHWKDGLADDVVVRRVPVIFQPSWRPLAKAYYTADALNLLGIVHDPLFDAIHESNIDLSSDERVRDFIVGLGAPSKDFDAVYQSFSINAQLQQSNALMRAYQVMSIPLFIVNGKQAMYVTDEEMAGSPDALFDVLDTLIAQERLAIQG